MQGKTRWATNVQLGDGQLEQLVKRGRQLHNQAVFDTFTWMVSIPVRLSRKYFCHHHVNKEGGNNSEKLALKKTPKIPA